MLKYITRLIASRQPRLTPRQQTGLWGEKKAARFLTANGYKIIGKRVRVGPRDEIDLIARFEKTLVFIEVKTRVNENFCRPFSAVNRQKRLHLSRAVIRYMKQLKVQPSAFRFDVIEIIGEKNTPNPIIRHIENAFPLPKFLRVL